MDFIESLKRLWTPPANPEDLSSSTRALLARLEAVDWFAKVGMPMDVGPDIQQLSGWSEAIEVCSSPQSEDAALEAQNELTMKLHARHLQAYQAWNSKVLRLKPIVVKLVATKLAAPSTRASVPDDIERAFGDSVRWDLLGLCMSYEYEHLVPVSKYYTLVEEQYLAGRFPCGWVGQVPDDMAGSFELGKLAVL